MKRSYRKEIMDAPGLSRATLKRFNRDLRLVHRLTGTAATLAKRMQGACTVLDIGCGDGALLVQIGHRTGARIVGLDLRPQPDSLVPILQRDAVTGEIPQAEAAYCAFLLHHLTEEQTIELIRNVGRNCKSFLILDLVRHPLPLVLFTLFIGPLLSKGAAEDGRLSIRRAYTAAELRALVAKALEGTEAHVHHWVSPYFARQIVTINQKP